MPNILLIRHGESESNAGLPTKCPESVELTKLGIHQAERIAEYLKEQVPPVLIVTSPYLRAKRTAELTKPFLPAVPVEEWPVQEFTYFSSWVQDVSLTVEDRRPLVNAYWDMSNPFYLDGPEAESFAQFIKRVRGVIKRLKETKYETIAIFSHEQFIRAFVWLTQEDPPMLDEKMMRHFRDLLQSGSLPNGAILRTQFDDSQEPWHWELITSHLENLTPVAAGRSYARIGS